MTRDDIEEEGYWGQAGLSAALQAPPRHSREAPNIQAAAKEKGRKLPELPPELSCRPSLSDMRQMSATELAAVKDFTIVRRGYGAIRCD
jgi:hypothetical protein